MGGKGGVAVTRHKSVFCLFFRSERKEKKSIFYSLWVRGRVGCGCGALCLSCRIYREVSHCEEEEEENSGSAGT